jgi:hypothetical protein
MTQQATTTHQNMQSCIDISFHCHQTCLQTAMNYCLDTGGKLVDSEHFRLMMNCAEICQVCANFQLTNSAFCVQICKLCADVCEACADDCEKLGGMDGCVKACRECAQCCRKLVV